MEPSPDRKGAIAEAAITCHAVRLGFDVYRPLVEGGRFDLVLGVGGALLRAQCKWSVRRGGAVVVRPYSCRRAPEGMRVRTYTEHEIDVVVAYCSVIDRCFALPPSLFVGRRQVHLRLDPAGNNQTRRINWADDYRLEDLHLFVTGP